MFFVLIMRELLNLYFRFFGKQLRFHDKVVVARASVDAAIKRRNASKLTDPSFVGFWDRFLCALDNNCAKFLQWCVRKYIYLK